MPSPVRYPGGVTNVLPANPLGQYGLPDPTKWHTYFNDFDDYVAGDWTVTVVGTTPSQALLDGDGGLIRVTNSAADNDSLQAQKVGEGFLLAAGKKAIFKARFSVSDVTQSDLLIGLAVLDTTLLGAIAGDGVTDGVFFQKDDGAATLDVYCQKDTTTGQTSATSIATLANNTFVSVAWYYDGVDSISYYIDDVKKGTLSATSTFLPDTEITLSYSLMNGEAVAKTMTLDYLLAAKER